MEEEYEKFLKSENALLMMLDFVTLVCVLISLFGVFSLVTLDCEKRRKEIAIRKVNGAEASSILELLSKDILVVALPAVILGSLASWYINGVWMEQFAEQIPLGWIVYLLVIIVNLVIIVGCVLCKSWRIANENPVNSIKSE